MSSSIMFNVSDTIATVKRTIARRYSSSFGDLKRQYDQFQDIRSLTEPDASWITLFNRKTRRFILNSDATTLTALGIRDGSDVTFVLSPPGFSQPKTVPVEERYLSRCGPKMYHQTSVANWTAISQSGLMLPGNVGLVGGGIYFTSDPAGTHGKAREKGVILECFLWLGSVAFVDRDGLHELTKEALDEAGFDTIAVARGLSADGSQHDMARHEYVVYSPDQVAKIAEHSRV